MEEIITFKTKYNKRQLLGAGTYGRVYKGILLATNEIAAIKVVFKKGKYHREVEVLKKLQMLNHKNLVRLLDFENLDKSLLIITEFCSLNHLSSYIESQKPLLEGVIQNFLKQLGEGYGVLKSNGIIHRDLKPKNILLCPSEFNQEFIGGYPHPTHIVLKIADFGISRFLDKDGRASTDIGTQMYKAPEMSRNNYDYKVDFFSIGMITVECIIGREELKKFEDKKKEYATFSPSIKKHAKKDLKELIRQLLKRNPSNRICYDDFMAHKFLNPGGSTRSASSSLAQSAQDNGDSQHPPLPSASYEAAPSPLVQEDKIQAFRTQVLSDSQQMNFSTQEMLTLSDEIIPQPHNKYPNALAAISNVRASAQNNGNCQPLLLPSASHEAVPSQVKENRIQAFQTQVLPDSQQGNCSTQEMPSAEL